MRMFKNYKIERRNISVMLLFVVAMLGLSQGLRAAPGDTTWVTVFENRKITQYGNIDTLAQLPATGVNYRKIRLHYILGRYACPAGEQYCGSWDYTTMIYAMPANADTVEMARIITPYATDWLASNRKHDYVVDVTDYTTILNGELPIRFKYEGYSWGFTLTLKIEYIEGTPPMNPLGFKNIYQGYFGYGNTSNHIENKLVPVNHQYTSAVKNIVLKNTVSGHGSDDTQCAEFCSKFYTLKINGTQQAQTQLWKSDCGKNNIYPQTGTWLYDRANWCPGEQVYPIFHPLTPYTQANANFSIDLDMQAYTAPNQANASGGYSFATQVIHYGDYNFQLDAAIEDIVAPTSDPNYFRSNGVCQTPIIKIKNTGAQVVTSMEFSYKLVGGNAATYVWEGSLQPGEEKVIELLGSFNIFTGNESNRFEVELVKVNQQVDEYALNNTYQSTFTHVRSYPSTFVVFFKTNNGTSGGYNETSWEIRNAAGEVVESRTNNTNNTTYKDTITLETGCYTFKMTDANCDGISWWAYQYYNPNPGAGIIRFSRAESAGTLRNFGGDFGCEFEERFTVGYTLQTDDLQLEEGSILLYPNPSENYINIDFQNPVEGKIIYSIIDLNGKVLIHEEEQLASDFQHKIDLSLVEAGFYRVDITTEKGKIQKSFVKN
jgi:hypothetical protein